MKILFFEISTRDSIDEKYEEKREIWSIHENRSRGSMEISRIIETEERQGVKTEREPGAVSIQCRPWDDLHSYRTATWRRIPATGGFVRLPPNIPPLPLADPRLWIHVVHEQRFHRLPRLLLESPLPRRARRIFSSEEIRIVFTSDSLFPGRN